MGDEDGFLRAIASAPEDEAPRLVYADWLEERGDPRAEFLRVEMDLDRIAPRGRDYAALRARARALRRQIDPGWAEAVGCGPRHRPLFATLPASRRERWALVEEFVEVWHNPLAPGDGFSDAELDAAEARLGCRLPAALREWYVLAGRRRDLWSRQDHLAPPDRLHTTDSGDLIFRWENQGNENWAIRSADLGRDDPPVVELGAGVESSPTVSAFACLVLAYESMFSVRGIYAGGEISDEQVRAAAVRGLSPCDLPEQYWVVSPLRLFEGTDLIVQVQADSWVYVTARTEAAYERVCGEVRRWLEVYR